MRATAGALSHCRSCHLHLFVPLAAFPVSYGTSYHRWPFTAPLPPARACAAIPYSHCHCRALVEPQLHTLPCPGLLPTSPGLVQLPHSTMPWFHFHQRSLTPVSVQTTVMVRTRGGSRLRPRVRLSTPEREEQAPVPAPVLDLVPAPVPEAVPEEPQGFRRYQTRMGPRTPSPMPQRRSRRARPSKRARTSGPGESSSSRPQPSPATSAAEVTSSPQLSPASRIRRPLFVGNPIPGNVRLHRREFHQESYYDVPALMADHRFRDSMRLIEHYSLLPFMRLR